MFVIIIQEIPQAAPRFPLSEDDETAAKASPIERLRIKLPKITAEQMRVIAEMAWPAETKNQ